MLVAQACTKLSNMVKVVQKGWLNSSMQVMAYKTEATSLGF